MEMKKYSLNLKFPSKKEHELRKLPDAQKQFVIVKTHNKDVRKKSSEF